jgi:hypothetical protein
MTRRYALRDDQWERIKNLLPDGADALLANVEADAFLADKIDNRP